MRRTTILPRRSTDRLRVLVVAESFLPQVNGVTNSVRRVLEHLAAQGHTAELIAPTGPAAYAGFPVTIARGASLPFYREFRIGLESRDRQCVVQGRGVDVRVDLGGHRIIKKKNRQTEE